MTLASLIHRYFADPDEFWDGSMVRQAKKLERNRDRLLQSGEWGSVGAAADMILARATARESDGVHHPVYVTGLGGSGSHWLAQMLTDLDGFAYCGEVYFSQPFLDALESLTPAERRIAVDSVHLLHGLKDEPEPWTKRSVNCAAGAGKTTMYKRWDPDSVVVYLYRDPRDQVISTTFRKSDYREFIASDESDDEYLRRRIVLNRNDRGHYRAGDRSADVEVSYEELARDASPALAQIALAAGVELKGVASAVFRHDATNIRAGAVESKGNLNLSDRGDGWRSRDIRLNAIIHSEPASVIEELGYPFGFCLFEPERIVGSNSLEVHTGSLKVLRWVRGEWQEPLARQQYADAPILVRLERGDSIGEAIRVMAGVAVDTLCLSSLDEVSADDLCELLRVLKPSQLDLGTVALDADAAECLFNLGSSLRSLNVWRAFDSGVVERLMVALPYTAIIS